MKVLVISFYYYPELGAAPSRMTSLVEGLKKEGIDVDVLTTLPNYPKGKIFQGYRKKISVKEKINDINIYRYWTYASVSKNPILRAWGMMSYSLIMWLFALKRKLIKGYDCVIVQSPPLFVSYSATVLFKKLFRRKLILNISDLWPISAIELGVIKEGSRIHKVFSYIERFVYRNVDGILGQSNEILKHITQFESPKEKFLYRNLQRYEIAQYIKKRNKPVKIVYAGLLGIAQNILGIIENIDFKAIGAEFHLYGGGNQTSLIEDYLKTHDTNVYYHGYVSKNEIANELAKYDASIVPLVVQIKGAVPSKIFDLLPMGIPILFGGGGEGADIVKQYDLGFISSPGDYRTLAQNIKKISELSDTEYAILVNNGLNAAKTDFNFDIQIKHCCNYIKQICL